MNYIGTKKVVGTPMTRLDYNQLKGWELPADENGADEGYLVEYDNGHQSWSPKDVFEDSYRPCNALNFGLAIEALKQGKRVTRPSWNGKNMWLVYVGAGHYDVGARILGADINVTYAPWVGMKTAQGMFTPWIPAQSDQLADDWQILEDVVEAPGPDVVRIPLKDGSRKNLHGLIHALGKDTDLTDSIESIKLIRIVTRDGVEVAINHSRPIRHQREWIINGTLGNIAKAPFSIGIDPETFNTSVSVNLPADYPMDLFVELEAKLVNHNRR
ncbi:hypothetical protein D3C85_89910 [compost metagenome]